MDKIRLNGENGEAIEFFLLESTRLAGRDYLLVTDAESGDGSCYILRDDSAPEEEEAAYTIVEDDHELEYLGSVFAELLEDADIEI